MSHLFHITAIALSCHSGLPAGDDCGSAVDHLISGRFLLSLWWWQLTTLGSVVLITVLITATIVARTRKQPALEPPTVNLAERLRQLTEN